MFRYAKLPRGPHRRRGELMHGVFVRAKMTTKCRIFTRMWMETGAEADAGAGRR